MMGYSSMNHGQSVPFVPAEFEVPALLETEDFRIRMLTVNDVVKDYDAVMNPDETICLGCVYIDPCQKTGYDAEVYLWVRKSAFDEGLDPVLYRAIRDWVENEWPFQKVAYPGRGPGWEEWDNE